MLSYCGKEYKILRAGPAVQTEARPQLSLLLSNTTSSLSDSWLSDVNICLLMPVKSFVLALLPAVSSGYFLTAAWRKDFLRHFQCRCRAKYTNAAGLVDKRITEEVLTRSLSTHPPRHQNALFSSRLSCFCKNIYTSLIMWPHHTKMKLHWRWNRTGVT